MPKTTKTEQLLCLILYIPSVAMVSDGRDETAKNTCIVYTIKEVHKGRGGNVTTPPLSPNLASIGIPFRSSDCANPYFEKVPSLCL